MQEKGHVFLSKVPQITVYFWIIKVLCTTVGETAADFLSDTLGLGLTITSIVMSVLLVIALVWQFKAKRYIPTRYWLSVVLISIVGTLITDNLTDGLGVPLIVSTATFAVILGVVFWVWYAKEQTLSIHSIVTRSREWFYWFAILFTFALGTALGDLIAESFGLGYLLSIILFTLAIGIIFLCYKFKKVGPVLSFWIAYILTRPLGASIGDFLSQAKTDGGVGLGTVITSGIFVAAIGVVVIYLTVTKKDSEKVQIS
ncbi:MAG TPA: hypothetical protein VG621_01185 [Candidatus Paceibacterota bacterium]|nr:hypothetical protein [Candidatus Paceibacterota bacterium]